MGGIYRGFISYSQKDKAYAARLHKKLESYRLPASIAKDNEQDQKLGRFFRDDAEIGSTSDLGATIREALESSENLIVICSENSATSKWVNEEISWFLKFRDKTRVFLVRVSGEPFSEQPLKECLPEVVKKEMFTQGMHGSEPYILDSQSESFLRGVTRIVAGITNIDFDALWDRKRRQYQARNLFVLLIAIILTLASVAAGIHQIDKQKYIDFSQKAGLAYINGDINSALANASSAINLKDKSILLKDYKSDHELCHSWGAMSPPACIVNRIMVSIPRRTRIWNTQGDERVERSIFNVKFSPNAKSFFTSTMLGESAIWNSVTGERIFTLEDEKRSGSVEAVFSQDGAEILAIERKGRVTLWSAESGKLLSERESTGEKVVYAEFNTNDRNIIIVYENGVVSLWDPYKESEHIIFDSEFKVRTLWLMSKNEYADPETYDRWPVITKVTGANFVDRMNQITISSSDGMIRLWDVGKKRKIAQFPANIVEKNIRSIYTPVASLADAGNIGVTYDGDWTSNAVVWDLHTRQPLINLDLLPSGRIVKFRFDRAEKLLAITGFSESELTRPIFGDRHAENRITKIWDLQSYEELPQLDGGRGDVAEAKFSPDGTVFAISTVGDRSVRVWDPKTGVLLALLHGSGYHSMYEGSGIVYSLDISDDNRYLVTGGDQDGTSSLWTFWVPGDYSSESDLLDAMCAHTKEMLETKEDFGVDFDISAESFKSICLVY